MQNEKTQQQMACRWRSLRHGRKTDANPMGRSRVDKGKGSGGCRPGPRFKVKVMEINSVVLHSLAGLQGGAVLGFFQGPGMLSTAAALESGISTIRSSGTAEKGTQELEGFSFGR
jgi:hypothetical protein